MTVKAFLGTAPTLFMLSSNKIYYLETARLMRHYHTTVEKLAGIVDFHGIPACVGPRDTLVLPLDWDYGACTQPSAEAIGALRTFPVQGKPASKVHLFASGAMSERLRREVVARKIILTENAFTTKPRKR